MAESSEESKPSNLHSPLISNPSLYDPLQHMFHYLSVKDLSMLACVSKKFYNEVDIYYESICRQLSLEDALHTFFERQLILKEEVEVQRKLNKADHTFKWLFVKGLMLRRVYRKSVSQFSSPKLNNSKFLSRKYDSELRREIVESKSLCWLHLSCTFPSVIQGNYMTILRIDISSMTRPEYEGPVQIRVHWEDLDGFHQRKTEIKWQQLRDGFTKGDFISLKGAVACNYESSSGWFNICLEDFSLCEISDVTFEFTDAENNGWKSGMLWDYVELKPTDWDTS